MSEDLKASLAAAVARFFGADSPLRQAPTFGGRTYEERPQQRAMAEAIVQGLQAGKHLCVEAPTGVGKSFAYLIPAVYFARLTQRPVVVTTHTIALQEQLIDKDLPLLQRLLEEPFTAALAKGRENYLCTHRLQRVLADQDGYLPNLELLPEIRRIAEWANTTEDGTRATLNFVPGQATWASVCAEQGTCPCGDKDSEGGCFYLRARQRLHQADIVVANHALFCIDLALRRDSAGQQSLLPEYGAVVVDEAHTLEDVAATHLGLRLSTYGAMFLLGRLYNQRSGRGLLVRAGANDALQAAIEAVDHTDDFFSRMLQWVDAQDANPLPFTTPGHVPNLLAEPWGHLVEEVKLVLDDGEVDREIRQELKALAQRLVEYRENLDVFLNMTRPESVYWIERLGRGQQHLSFNVVPINVSGHLRPLLFEQPFSVVLTSATLAVGGNLDYFKKRIGAEAATTLVLDTPFDFAQQVDLYLPAASVPDPRSADFVTTACDLVRRSLLLTQGKAFVLFTSYQLMEELAQALAPFCAAHDLRLMVQGHDLPRSRMLAEFRANLNSVIFGTDSFWTGVDVPGEALSNVTIVKLPFPVPSHPLIRARSEQIDRAGGSSFREYSLPEAVLKFRQGFGRLIRTRDDTGVVVVLDRRIVHSSYGNVFLGSIPKCRQHLIDADFGGPEARREIPDSG